MSKNQLAIGEQVTHLAVTHKLRLRRIEQTDARLYGLLLMFVHFFCCE
jgi:hypothetical protein